MEVNYVIQKSRRRSMSIHVADDKKVIVKVPLGTPTFIAENFIKEKKDWITKQMEKVEKQTALADSMGPLTEEDIKQILRQLGGVMLGVVRTDAEQDQKPAPDLSVNGSVDRDGG